MPALHENRGAKLQGRHYASGLQWVLAVLLCLAGSAGLAAQNTPDPPQPQAVSHAGAPVKDCSSGCPERATAFVVQQPAEMPKESDTTFKAAVPLLQTLVWAVLIAGVAVMFRREIAALVENRHWKVKVGEVEIEVLPPEQVTDPGELEIREV